MKIAILVGHGKSATGGYDSGAVNGALALHEFKVCKEIAKSVADYLKDYGCTVELVNYYADKTLHERIKYCNDNAFDIVCELHLNAFTSSTARGTETYYYPKDETGGRLADTISKAISKKLGIAQRSNGIDDGGDKASDYYGIIRQTKGSAILVETCFLTTEPEAKKIDTLAKQIEVGKTIGQAIVESLKLVKSNQPDTSSQKMGRWCIGNFNESTKNRKDVAAVLEKARDIGYGVWYETI